GEPFEILGHRGEKIRRMNPGNFIALGTVSGEPVKELHFRLPPKPGAFARVLKLASCEMRTPEGQESTFSREGGVTVSFFKLNDELMEMVEAEGQSLQFWGMLENGKPLSIALEMTYLRDTPEGLTCEWYVIKKHRWTKLCRQSDGTATFEITSD